MWPTRLMWNCEFSWAFQAHYPEQKPKLEPCLNQKQEMLIARVMWVRSPEGPSRKASRSPTSPCRCAVLSWCASGAVPAHENDCAAWHSSFPKQWELLGLSRDHWLDLWISDHPLIVLQKHIHEHYIQGHQSSHCIGAAWWLDGQTHAKWKVEEPHKMNEA